MGCHNHSSRNVACTRNSLKTGRLLKSSFLTKKTKNLQGGCTLPLFYILKLLKTGLPRIKKSLEKEKRLKIIILYFISEKGFGETIELMNKHSHVIRM